MIQVKCIQKFRDKNNNIYGYRLIDINGQTQDVQPKNLKQAISSGKIHVVNLTLTSDGRLVDTTEKQLKSKSLGSIPQPPKSEVIKQKLIDIAKYIQNNKASYLSINYYDFFEDSDGDYAFSVSDDFDITVNSKEFTGHIEVYIKKNEISFDLQIQDEGGAITTGLEQKTVKLDIFKKTNNEINNIVAKYQEHIQNIYHCFVKEDELSKMEAFMSQVARTIFKLLGFSGEINELDNSYDGMIDKRYDINEHYMYFGREVCRLAITYYGKDYDNVDKPEFWLAMEIESKDVQSLHEIRAKSMSKDDIKSAIDKFVKEIRPHISIQ